MQQLLTGKKRLPGFDGEWEEVRLGEVSNVKKGKALNSKDLIDGKFDVIAGGKTSPYKHNDYTHQNVITISASGAYAGYVALYKRKIWASDCSVIQSKETKSVLLFLYYLLHSSQIKIYTLQSGGAQPHVYPKDLTKLKYKLPNIDEQTAIANILQTADKEIGIEKLKLNKLKEEKKGLMQQLLTGKKRLLY